MYIYIYAIYIHIYIHIYTLNRCASLTGYQHLDNLVRYGAEVNGRGVERHDPFTGRWRQRPVFSSIALLVLSSLALLVLSSLVLLVQKHKQ